MGYSTDFSGSLKLSRKLNFAEAKVWLELAEDRDAFKSQSGIDSYLQWVPSTDLEHLVWDGNEKFYDYIEALKWLLGKLKGKENSIIANGELTWQGESVGDVGIITVVDSEVSLSIFNANDDTYVAPLTLDELEKMALEQLSAAQAKAQQDDHDGSTND